MARRKVTKRSGKRRAARTQAAAQLMQFLHKPACTTCRKARTFLEGRGVELHFRNLEKERLSATELEQLIGSRDHTEFLNPKNDLYRKKKMK